MKSFPTTQWQLLGGAVETNAPGQMEALEALCKAYRSPVYVAVYAQVRDPIEAEDLTQGFFHHLLRNRGFAMADRERGRFRTFLLASLRNFLINQRAAARREKRAPETPLLQIETLPASTENGPDVADHESPDRVFERKWARAVVERVLDRLRYEFEDNGQLNRFEVLKNVLTGVSDETYAVLGAQLGLSESNVKVAVHRFRARYRDLFRGSSGNFVGNGRARAQNLRGFER